ncbi:carboxypeptidase-like regulatory domain-containing protein [Flavobacterium ginsengisoli]|uniref:carboxypeptidase-like regulatory domain-containing protein n=1 Tax=Flavobacterium ginsengisoli TaxID=871694 RepID=UPI0024158508|nr:carboxypeptidase-like regulatory domain-containing protein [Flavobacterium ginsengisoli]
MKKLLYIIILLPFIVNAQTVSGIVKSQNTNLPIEDTNIYALRTQIGTLTNENGEFSLNNKIKANDTLQVSHIGYITIKIAVKDLKKSNNTISLEEDIETLSNVDITSRKVKLKSKLDFTQLASLETGIYSFGSTVINDKIYVTGGDSSEESNALHTLKEKGIDSEDPKFEQKYLQLVGFQGSKNFYNGDLLIYDPKTDSWEKSAEKFKKELIII